MTVCDIVRTETGIVTHGMTMCDIVYTETGIVTYGMTICDIVQTETGIVTHGVTMCDIVRTETTITIIMHLFQLFLQTSKYINSRYVVYCTTQIICLLNGISHFWHV